MIEVMKHISSKNHLDIVALVQDRNVRMAMENPINGIRTDMILVVLARCTNKLFSSILIGGYGTFGVGMRWGPFDYYNYNNNNLGLYLCPHMKDIAIINAHRASMEAESRALKWIRSRTF